MNHEINQEIVAGKEDRVFEELGQGLITIASWTGKKGPILLLSIFSAASMILPASVNESATLPSQCPKGSVLSKSYESPLCMELKPPFKGVGPGEVNIAQPEY